MDDGVIEGDEPEPANAGLPLQPPISQPEADHHPTNGMCFATPPQAVENRVPTPILP